MFSDSLYPLKIINDRNRGRGVVSEVQIAAGNEILTDISLDIAIDPLHCNSNCFACGISNSDAVLASICDCGKFCELCINNSNSNHITSHECAILTTFKEKYQYNIPMQGVLTLRLLQKYPDGLSHLVGSKADCDEVRLEIAGHMQDVLSEITGVNYRDKICDILGVIHRNGFKFGCGITLFNSPSYLNHSCGPSAIMIIDYDIKGIYYYYIQRRYDFKVNLCIYVYYM
jgi:hypothetical protein